MTFGFPHELPSLPVPTPTSILVQNDQKPPSWDLASDPQ